ncbi:23S rRNA pseudouridine(1911/1915/1917) synthase [Flavobacteriaceae bacterium UJ101]|nr:23S rRNA pseudouridine(1911/1915/1917) synthase [Flavobacteriaceae bacterium UJ101]
MKIISKHNVSNLSKPIRLNDYLIGVFPQLSTRKSIKKALKKGLVLYNNQKATSAIWVENNKEIILLEAIEKPPKAFPLKLTILFEDNFIAIIHKPAGIITSGNQFKTIQNALLYNLQPSLSKDKLNWPKPVHRLDKQTSGLLLIAKTKQADLHLKKQFEQHTIQKMYQALVCGKTVPSGTISIPIDNKESFTSYKTIESVPSIKNNFISWVSLFPKTGRTHQLRIHLSKIGYPILGDPLYGTENRILKNKGLFLCATQLQFTHPISLKETIITINPPKKFKTRMNNELKMWNKKFETDPK